MRRLTLCCVSLLLVSSPPALGQSADPPRTDPEPEPEVLIGNGVRHGGWGAPVVHVSTVRDRTAVFVGGRGGWLLDGRFTIGGGGFGLASQIRAPTAVQVASEPLDLQMGYGGAWLEYTFTPSRLLHVSVGTLLGGGELSLAFRHGGSYGSRSDAFFVAEPAVVGELNLVRWARLDLGIAYRAIAGVNMEGLSYSDVAGFSAVAALKFGKF